MGPADTPEPEHPIVYPGAPPAISGGTLALSPDGRYAVAADPDRDQIHVVELASGKVVSPKLTRGSEPGRVAFDGAGRAHVALRGAGKLALVEPSSGEIVRQTSVCSLPRGAAFDAAQDAVVVACAGGELVTLAAADHAERARIALERDLRDVVIGKNGERFVSRYRSAELLELAPDGALVQRKKAPHTRRTSFGPPIFFAGAAGAEVGESSGALVLPEADAGVPGELPTFDMAPTLGWRLTLNAQGELVLLHQRAQLDEVVIQQNGYGSGGCDTISQTGFATFHVDGSVSASLALGAATLAVDAAFSADGKWVAVAAPGELMLPQRTGFGPLLGLADPAFGAPMVSPSFTVQVFAVADFTLPPEQGCQFPLTPFIPDGSGTGQVIAVSFTLDGKLVVQSRQPAQLQTFAYSEADATFTLTATIPLAEESVQHPGHDLFHANVGGGLACASCHGEAMDDGHVWSFAGFGPRRTQNMRGGFLGTEPFHWEGDMADFRHLVDDVMTMRMGGFAASDDDVNALATWIDAMPALRPTTLLSEAAERGATLFASEEVGCASCHSGPLFTNNESADVGTGELLQVPSLLGLALRAPYMHDGCAATLTQRFEPGCGGGDQHGRTSQLSEAQIADLVAYLETL